MKYIGEKFGMLTILSEVGKDRHGARIVNCRCDCGREKKIPATRVVNGYSRSCGCKKNENHNAWCKRTFAA